MPPAKETIARVTNPLGTQESRKFRLLGETKNIEVSKEQDPRVPIASSEWSFGSCTEGGPTTPGGRPGRGPCPPRHPHP
jgi:hypothetical protein